MLKYFKRQKSRRRENTNDDECCDVDGIKKGDALANGDKRHSLRSTSSFCDEIYFDDVAAAEVVDGSGCSIGAVSISTTAGTVGIDGGIFNYHSRLSVNLQSIVTDPNCLSYFVQFLESRDALSLIKFYLDTENFKTVALAQLEKAKINSTIECQEFSTEFKKESEEDDEPVHNDNEQRCTDDYAPIAGDDFDDIEDVEELANNVPELKTLCDLSMRQSLTDDEKSQIYAETNKFSTKCSNSNNLNNDNTILDFDYLPHSRLKSGSEQSLCTNATSINDFKLSSASIKDAITIYQKYLIANAKEFVYLPVTILSQLSLLLCKCDTDDEDTTTQTISAHCFDEAQEYVLQQMEILYLNEFLQSTLYCQYCIDLIEHKVPSVANDADLSICDILYSEVTLFFLMEFLEQHGERDCLDFWTSAINFRKSFVKDAEKNKSTTISNNEAKTDAMIIYEKFFSLQSEQRLWVSDKLRAHVEQRICADEVNSVAHCFDLPLQIVVKYLERKHLQNFLKSSLFANYLDELKTKVQEEFVFGVRPLDGRTSANTVSHIVKVDVASLPTQQQQNKFNLNVLQKMSKHRKTRSDCTHEMVKHISQQNTLLAMADSNHGTGKKASNKQTAANLNLASTSYSIDARQWTNPNLLWQRSASFHDGTKCANGLKFGSVNALGRYERDFDNIDTFINNSSKNSWLLSKGGSKLKNAMRKLVNLPEEKVQEEIAWQVAEMIVKDVTNITLNGGNNNMEGKEQFNLNKKAIFELEQKSNKSK